MRRLRTVPPLAIAALIACSVAGCLPLDPAPVATIAPTGTPLFSSDEEALAAAEEAYGAYLAVSGQILNDGGAQPERIDEVVADEIAAIEKAGYLDLANAGLRTVGRTTFYGTVLQRFEGEPANGRDVVTVYLCSDVSGVDVLDSAGNSVVSPDRPPLTPFEVAFDLADGGFATLVVSRKDPWPDSGVCS